MPALSAPPRAHLAPQAVHDLVHADDLEVAGFGADLLDTTDQVIGDLTPHLRSGSVTWDGAVDLHRSCELVVDRELAWGRDRLRVHQTLTSALVGITATFWLGVFVLTRPTFAADGSDVVEHQVKGWDKTYLLRSPVADTWATRWVESGQATTVGAEVRRVLRGAGYTGAVALAPEVETTFLPEPMVWPLDEKTSWLRVANDVLGAGAFTGLWADEAGVLRADPLTPLEERPVELVLDADDARTTLLGPVRTRTQDLAEVPNSWRFINTLLEGEPLPGQGIYDPPDNESDGLTSIAARGYRLRRPVKVEAADQDALVRIGNERVAADRRAAGGRALTTAPLPLLGHRTHVQLVDAAHGPPARALVTRWGPLDLAGADVPVTVEEVA